MRAPNGAKMNLNSALFQRVKIMRIHCKKQGLGGGNHLKTVPTYIFFIFFCKKNCFFTTQHFASTGSLFFRFKDLLFHHFRGVLGCLFSGRDFGIKREHAQFQLQKTEFSVGHSSQVMLQKLDFSVKTCPEMNCKLIGIFRTFSGNRHHSHTGARFWEGLHTKKVKTKVFVLAVLKLRFS